jgi:hypothetical protein
VPTKTDRILGYLPATYRPTPQRSALRATVGAFGGELQQAENQLAEVMQSHWVDYADRGATVVHDLELIAALYGLAPRDDETVEEFREHLKRYVRTFLEGTVTVQGILRVAAETLGLTIADRADELDAWWKRAGDELVTHDLDQIDAATMLLGVAAVDERGTAARRAHITGTPDLSAGVDLREHRFLYVVVDDGTPDVVDLSQDAPDPAAVTLDHIVSRLVEVTGLPIAHALDARLVVNSLTLGPMSRLELREGPDDAATAVLGLLPLSYRGRDATSAEVTSVDLSAGVDVQDARYLRLLIDGTHLAEIDIAGADPALTFLDEIRDAVNTALGVDVAAHDGRILTLRSPTTGITSTIAFQRPAAQDAAARLFGDPRPLFLGSDPQPAVVTGSVDLADGVDLGELSLLRLRVDDLPTVTIDCAGAVPEHTHLDEVIAAINTGLGAEVAGRDGTRLRLRSPATGDLAEVALDPLTNDAAPRLLGIPPRLAAGSAATVANVTGTESLVAGVSLSARHTIEVAVDGAGFVRIDLRAGGAASATISLDDVVARISAALGDDIATHDGEHLILRSRDAGGGSRITVRPLTEEHRRRFVTRAYVTGEAARTVLGVDAASGRGDDAGRASITGDRDLSRGVDLSVARYLRIAVDDAAAVDVDCAGPRPRATLIEDVVTRINAALASEVAAHDGVHLTLTSPTAGAGSRIAFETPQAQDARGLLLGVPPGTARGTNATGVSFVGVEDLAAGVDLPAGAAMKIGIDGADPVEVVLTGEEPAHRSLGALAAAVNVALGDVAGHDGTHLAIVSPSTGAGSSITFETPAGTDVTGTLLGISAPRTYHGADAQRARLVGAVDIAGPLALDVQRYLSVSVDGDDAVNVDFGTAPDPTAITLDEVVAAINTQLQAAVAEREGARLVLRSRATGTSGRVTVGTFTAGDAREQILGPAVAPVTEGSDPQPATVTGTVDLLGPADLSRRSVLRISVDGGAPRDIDVAGASAAQSSLDEIVAAIDAVFPGVAAPTADRRLQLASRTSGTESRLDVLPVRSLEVLEYPPVWRRLDPRAVRHGDRFPVDNTAAGATIVELEWSAPQGNGGAALVNASRGWIVRLLRPLSAGERAYIRRGPDGRVGGEIVGASGPSPVPARDIHAGPIGAWAAVPFAEPRVVPGTGLQLVDDGSPRGDLLIARGEGDVLVEVAEAAVDETGPYEFTGEDGDEVEVMGRLAAVDDTWHLEDGAGTERVALRAGPGVSFGERAGAVVSVRGPYHVGDEPYVLVQSLHRRFDVEVWPAADPTNRETYASVTIGGSTDDMTSLVWQAEIGPAPSSFA